MGGRTSGQIRTRKSMATQESREEIVEDNEAYPLSGEIRSTSFSDLTALAKDRNVLLIDCSNLKRIDFSSTGALLNALVSVHQVDKKDLFPSSKLLGLGTIPHRWSGCWRPLSIRSIKRQSWSNTTERQFCPCVGTACRHGRRRSGDAR